MITPIYTFPPSTPAAVVTDNDVEITDPSKGLVVQSPDETKWRVTVDDTGALDTNEV